MPSPRLPTAVSRLALLALIPGSLMLTALARPWRAWASTSPAAVSRPAAPDLAPKASEPEDLPDQRIVLKLASEPARPLLPGATGHASLDRLMDELEVSRIEAVFDESLGDLRLKRELGLARYVVLTLPASVDTEGAVQAFSADPAVEVAEPDQVGWGGGVPDDTEFGQQWNLHNAGQTGGTADADVDAPEAWDLTIGTATTVLAIIDSGVDLDHPDFAGKLVPGYDFVNGDAEPQDDHGHGTHVAGIAAANSNNGLGIAGLCWECRVMPLKALNSDNWGFYSWWAAAIAFAVDNGAVAINMSMGGTGASSVLLDAVRYAHGMDVPIAAAMMNDGNSTVYYPAGYAETIAVGSTDWFDSRSDFSNFGSHM